jgi:hypothetical protein
MYFFRISSYNISIYGDKLKDELLVERYIKIEIGSISNDRKQKQI